MGYALLTGAAPRPTQPLRPSCPGPASRTRVQPDEKELLTQVFAGAPGAFETLLERYRGLVFAVFSAPGFDFPRHA